MLRFQVEDVAIGLALARLPGQLAKATTAQLLGFDANLGNGGKILKLFIK
jgi:hypothetical protein